MLALARVCKTGDLVAALGARGCLTADRTTGKVAHVALHDTVAPRVQAEVLAHPARKNGVGDRFFGAFVLAHAFAKRGCHNRTAQAAHSASLEMVRQLAPALAPARHWVIEQPVAGSFGADKGRRRPKAPGEKTTLLPQWLPAPAAVALR